MRSFEKLEKIKDKMISSGDYLRKPPPEIDLYRRFLKKTATRNLEFVQVDFLRNRL
jgi:hypothetical protein